MESNTSYSGILHKYNFQNVAFEFLPSNNKKVLVFIGGLGDGLLTVPYLPKLAMTIEKLGFSLIQIQSRSSFKGWGISSLNNDIEDIKDLVRFLRSDKGGNRTTIILMGHSTGSQDTIHYLLNDNVDIDGGIMQGSVSDREMFNSTISKSVMKRLNTHALKLIEKNQGKQLLTSEYSSYLWNTPITAYRWCSLMLPGGDDDYFSSDLSNYKLINTFGKINKPFLIIYSEHDEFVPQYIDKKRLIERWISFSNPKYCSRISGLINEASHNVKEIKSQDHLCLMITEFFKEFNF